MADLSVKPRSPLRQKSVAALITAQVISSLGSQMTMIGSLPFALVALRRREAVPQLA